MRLFTMAALSLAALILLPVVALGGSGTTTGTSNLMNPALSLNGLFAGQTSDERDGSDVNGLRMQEVELHASSIVDPFWSADIIVAVETNELADGYDVGVEVARVDATSLPYGLGLRMGKFFMPFGKHSPLHTHQFPFVESPLAVRSLLGDGFTDAGVQMAYPAPLPWYSDVFVYGVDGSTEMFDNADRDIVWGARWINLWDLGDETTLEAGGSYCDGPGDAAMMGRTGRYGVSGVDLTIKWVDMTSSHGPALTIQGELLVADSESGDPMGWYALAQYRVSHNWWVGATHGRVELDGGVTTDAGGLLSDEVWESKVNLTYVPSEFSALRAEVGYFDDRIGDRDELRASIQLNFTIGSHPAHSY
jgi:hypothetical protein